MESDKIEKILEKYFEAGTTPAEEGLLREYFAKEGIAPHLQAYAPMFGYLSSAREERFTRQVPLKTRSSFYRWMSVAAVAVLIFGVYFGLEYQKQKQAEYAYNETRKALNLLAQNLERGTEKVAYLKEFEEATEKIYNN